MQALVEYRFFHVLWLVGAILTRRYRFNCGWCSGEFEARSPRLKRPVRTGRTFFLSLGPLFLIILGGALILIGPGDYTD